MTIAQIEWNIKDAREALECAILMQNWTGVIKYASQLQRLEADLYRAAKN